MAEITTVLMLVTDIEAGYKNDAGGQTITILAGALAAAVHAQAHTADGVAGEAQGDLPTLRLPAGGGG